MFGLLLVKFKNKCISFIYSIEIIILFLIFGLASVIIVISVNKIKDDITCEDLDILKDADELYTKSKDLLCSENCIC